MEADHVTYEKEEYGHNHDEDDFGNLRNLLEQKDRDLMLAAELGKALLDKNADLEKKIEQVNEDYSQRIEVSVYIHVENLIKLHDPPKKTPIRSASYFIYP